MLIKMSARQRKKICRIVFISLCVPKISHSFFFKTSCIEKTPAKKGYTKIAKFFDRFIKYDYILNILPKFLSYMNIDIRHLIIRLCERIEWCTTLWLFIFFYLIGDLWIGKLQIAEYNKNIVG